MRFDTNEGLQVQGASISDRSRKWTGQVVRLAAVLLLSTAAFAQYGGGGTVGGMGTPTSSGTYSPAGRSYGHGAAIGAGVGAAAIGAGAVYLMTHRSSKISGCVETSDDGLNLIDDRTKKTLMLVPGKADVKAGDRVELKGKFKQERNGRSEVPGENSGQGLRRVPYAGCCRHWERARSTNEIRVKDVVEALTEGRPHASGGVGPYT